MIELRDRRRASLLRSLLAGGVWLSRGSPTIKRAEIAALARLGLRLQEDHVNGAERGSPVLVELLDVEGNRARAERLLAEVVP